MCRKAVSAKMATLLISTKLKRRPLKLLRGAGIFFHIVRAINSEAWKLWRGLLTGVREILIFETYLLGMKKNWLCLLCIVLVVLISCEKDPPPEKTSYFMDEEFLDHTIFKPGSWWVYEKDTMTPTDSVYVIKSEVTNMSHDSVDYNWQRSVIFGPIINEWLLCSKSISSNLLAWYW